MVIMESDFETQGNKTKRIKVEEESTNRMETLPRDIILNILSGLPISSLVQFRCVCRSWRLLGQDPDLVNMHSSRMAESNPTCLIFHCDYPIKNQLYFVEFPSSNEKVKKFQVPFCSAMPEFDVVGTCDGLLCLSDSLFNDALYIYNPFTRNCKELPKPMHNLNQEVVYGFGFHPTTKEYKVVKIVYIKNSNKGSAVQVFTLGSSAWRSLEKVNYHLVNWPSQQVCVNGRLHWVTRPGRYTRIRSIISFDLADEKFRAVPSPDGNGLSRCNYHLVVLGGCLSAAVYCHYGKLDIWVMEKYGVKESWIKKFNLGNYVPKGFQREMEISYKISRFALKGRFVRVVGLTKDGQFLLEYRSRALVSYDPKSTKAKDLVFPGMPKWYRTIVHVGSLNWIDAFTHG